MKKKKSTVFKGTLADMPTLQSWKVGLECPKSGILPQKVGLTQTA